MDLYSILRVSITQICLRFRVRRTTRRNMAYYYRGPTNDVGSGREKSRTEEGVPGEGEDRDDQCRGNDERSGRGREESRR